MEPYIKKLVLFSLSLIISLSIQAQKQPNADRFMEKGGGFFDVEEYNKAIDYYSAALKQDENLSKAYYNRGLAFYRTGKYNRAILDFDKVIQIDKRDFEAFEQRANAKMMANDPEGAVEDYSLAINGLDDVSNILFVNRAVVQIQLENFEESLFDLEAALKRDPKDFEALSTRGDAYAAMGSFDLAIEDYNQALSINPQDERALNNRANAFKIIGNREAALADYSRAIAIKPNSGTLTNRGFFYLEKDELEAALADCTEASRLDYKNAGAFNCIATVMLEKNKTKEALENFTRAIEIDHTYTDAFLNRGEINLALGNFQSAILDFEHVIIMEPENRLAIELLSKAKNEDSNAIAYEDKIEPATTYEYLNFEEPISNDSQLEESQKDKITTYEYNFLENSVVPNEDFPIGDTEAPQIEFAPRSGNLTKDVKLYNNALENSLEGNYTAALIDIEAAIDQSPAWKDQYFHLNGILNYEVGDYEAALFNFNQTLELNPLHKEGYFNRAIVKFQLKQDKEACEDCQKAAMLGLKDIPEWMEERCRNRKIKSM